MKLLEKFRFKEGIELKNRIVMPAITVNFTEKGEVSDKLVDFYLKMAKGGVGMIIVGGCTINETAGGEFMLSLKDDYVIEEFKKLTEAISREGAVPLAQLFHGGRYVHSFLIKGRKPLSPSPVISRYTGELPKEMTIEEIIQVEEDFVKAAIRAIKAGFNGVEIIGSAGYLISQFLSPAVNKRKDLYGGGRLNRFRFLKEIILKIREGIGDKVLLGVRLSGNEYIEGGGGIEDLKFYLKELNKLPVSYVSITGGWHEATFPQITYHVPPAAFSYLGRIAKQHTDLPIILSNRINRVEVGEELLNHGYCDLVAMGRAVIVEPELPLKVLNDEPLFHCIACNQGCFDNIMTLKSLECSVRPELELGDTIHIASKKRRVVVVGAGPAGLRVAYTASRRGHEVLLFEKEKSPGGLIKYISRLPHKKEFIYIIQDLISHIEKLKNVKLYLEVEMTPLQIKEVDYDAVVIATGSTYPPPLSIKGIDGKWGNIYSVIDILKDNFVLTGDNVVIIGGGGAGLDVALKLASIGTLSPDQLYFLFRYEAEKVELLKELVTKGKLNITVVEKLRHVGKDIGPSTRWVIKKEIEMRGINLITESEVVEVKRDSVVIVHRRSEKISEVPADLVIYATGCIPQRSLYDTLHDKIDEIYLVGGALGGRDIKFALSSSEKVARLL